MRHQKRTFKVGRTDAHKRCMIANMLKSLIDSERIETTVTKAKELRRHAEMLVTLAKRNTLSTRREAISRMMIRFNSLTSKQARLSKEDEKKRFYNTDRKVLQKLFNVLGPRYQDRAGGYTRIIKTRTRDGDNAQMCVIEYLE